MRSVFLLLLFFCLYHLFVSVSCGSFKEFVYPNFTASNLRFIDSSKGAFLFSPNSIFKAGLFSPGDDSSSDFYFSIIHVDSDSTIWSSNRDSPVSRAGKMNLSPQGISVIEDGVNQTPVWSTPVLASPVHSLRLTDSGNLLLLDGLNASLWESFRFPTDTIVLGQRLPVGMFLSGSVSRYNLSQGDYKFVVVETGGFMKWRGQNYWKLRMHTQANVDSNFPVEFLTVTTSGLALMGRNGTTAVIRVPLPPSSDFRVAKMDPSGQFIVSRFSGKSMVTEISGPMDPCQVPLVCGKLRVCHLDNDSENESCSCVDGMRLDAGKNTCVPVNQSLSLPVTCEGSNVSYFELGHGLSYFSTRFTDPVEHDIELSTCHDLCSKNCSCLGVFYENTSRSCYLVKDSFGSLSLVTNSKDNHDLIGYVKLSVKKMNAPHQPPGGKTSFPLIALVLLPCSGFFLVIALGFLWWRRCAVMRYSSIREKQATRLGSFGSGDLGSFRIPGLPRKFEFEELEQATENFKLQIGSGGFGAVYKGTLPDETLIAVKKITNHGLNGRQEFCTEIAVIGNIRHANLVKLRGFCARAEENHQNNNSSTTTTTSSGLVYFPLYALDMHEQGSYMELADPRLEGRVTSQEVAKLVRIALCCVHEEPALRPTMAAVVGMFEGTIPVGNPRMESLNFLRFYGLRFAESSIVEGGNGESDNMGFHRRESSNSGGSRQSASYVASQEVSGPR
ncbi:hypothetical protein IGI04_034718 [Brassica rapa subsp. trilocularis]|uniref:Receptor-like serine/threonine-protein kinase n=1 Tax=Brassica rapa subsp. trilocularis TaxID=1813537 RepID=A0ABQ7LCS0_BRACM|nr:hypothetical protein IGI04_034718 [Brassica rapa subsp. trilocularis]